MSLDLDLSCPIVHIRLLNSIKIDQTSTMVVDPITAISCGEGSASTEIKLGSSVTEETSATEMTANEVLILYLLDCEWSSVDQNKSDFYAIFEGANHILIGQF